MIPDLPHGKMSHSEVPQLRCGTSYRAAHRVHDKAGTAVPSRSLIGRATVRGTRLGRGRSWSRLLRGCVYTSRTYCRPAIGLVISSRRPPIPRRSSHSPTAGIQRRSTIDIPELDVPAARKLPAPRSQP